jgi:AraC-like DNA-binding protein
MWERHVAQLAAENAMEPTASMPRGRLPVRFRLDVSVNPGNAREFEFLRSGLAPLYALDAPSAQARTSFGAKMTSYQFADIALATSRASAATFERTKQTIARSSVDNIGLVLYSKGGAHLDVEGRSADVHPGDVCILDMTRPSALRAPEFNNLSLVLPRALIEPHLADLDRLHGLILNGASPLNAMLVSHLRTLQAQAPALSVSDAGAATQGAIALIAAFAGASADGRDTIRNAAVAMSAQAARRTIEASLHDPELGPDFICKRLGMSRAKLYRLFEPEGGVGHYILQRRMTRAYRNIIDPACAHERIGTIAARCGFSNASVFSRAFRQAHGASPTELRDALACAGPADIAPTLENDFEAMNRWLSGANTVA